jgi:glutathione synthase/RimK-type ligase-like ATP-grasp enzyme
VTSRIAFLTMDDLTGYVSDDDLALDPLARLGWEVDAVSWRAPDVDWTRWSAVVIRSTWDYQKDVAGFLATLEGIVAAGVPLANPIELVRENVTKTYLPALAARGCPIPRTRVVPALADEDLVAFASGGREHGIVAKPLAGGGGADTFHVRPDDPAAHAAALLALAGRETVLQDFMPAVLTEGELSLVYFGGRFSHALRKAPSRGEFRVQEEHGGIITAARPDSDSIRVAEAVLRTLDETPLYARVDLVNDRGEPVLMELELVEPSLYLRTDPGAPARFAAAVDGWVRALARPPLSPTRPTLSSRP